LARSSSCNFGRTMLDDQHLGQQPNQRDSAYCLLTSMYHSGLDLDFFFEPLPCSQRQAVKCPRLLSHRQHIIQHMRNRRMLRHEHRLQIANQSAGAACKMLTGVQALDTDGSQLHFTACFASRGSGFSCNEALRSMLYYQPGHTVPACC
jgi:hypothetical protein